MLILEADARFRAEWWDQLTQDEKQRLVDSPDDEARGILGRWITTERGIKPPDLSDLRALHELTLLQQSTLEEEN